MKFLQNLFHFSLDILPNCFSKPVFFHDIPDFLYLIRFNLSIFRLNIYQFRNIVYGILYVRAIRPSVHCTDLIQKKSHICL